MIREEDVYKIGILNKPHGTRGELQFTITDDGFDPDTQELDFIFGRMDGILVPFYVEDYRFRSNTAALLKLEGIDTEEQARKMTNVEVYYEINKIQASEEGELNWNFFRGCTVEDVNAGDLGKVTDVDNSTINTLFIIEKEGKELMIPAQEEFIVELDEQRKHLVLDVPEGLLKLNAE